MIFADKEIFLPRRKNKLREDLSSLGYYLGHLSSRERVVKVLLSRESQSEMNTEWKMIGRKSLVGSRWSVVSVLLTVYSLLSTVYCLPAAADVTNTWHFTNNTYTISNPLLIEVNTNAPGYAQMILDTRNNYYTTLADYTNASYRNLIGLGYDSFLRLTGSPGAYSASGTFISRVIDGGSGGNNWQMFHARASNRSVSDGRAQSLPGLIALWHMNNDWLDTTANANNGTAFDGATFATSARFGAASGFFDGTNDYVATAKTYANGGLFSISFWVKADARIDSVPFKVPIGFGGFGGVWLGGVHAPWWWKPSYGIGVANSGYSGGWHSISNTFSASQDAGVWRHIVVTYDSSISGTNNCHVYKDGIEQVCFYSSLSGDIAPSMSIKFGGEQVAYFGTEQWPGLIDEVALYNRVLSSNEVVSLYNDWYTLVFKVKSGTTSDLSGKNFVGPDGTTNSFYTGVHETLQSGGDFDVSNRFVQYKADFSSPAVLPKTPCLESVAFFGSIGAQFDNNGYDFNQGSYLSITNEPLVAPMPSLGLAKNINGGYCTNGTFTSRELDAGGPVTWGTILWKEIPELSPSLYGLVGLWHMNWGWGSEKGGFTAMVSGGATFSTMAKLGNGSGLFNGTGSRVDISLGTSVQALDFWVKDSNINDGIMEVIAAGGTAYLSISNHTVSVQGNYGTTGKLYVNGDSACAKLLNGWNHVALVFGNALTVNGINLGLANGDFMEGMLDELGTYNYSLLPAEITEHFTSGRRQAAGTVQALVRYGDALPLTNSFFGPYGNSNSLALPTTGQYLQYRMIFNSDGDSTPLIDSVSVSHNGAGSPFVDNVQSNIVKGTFDSSQTAWYGDDIKLLYPASVGPANMIPDTTTLSLWHMDETTWTNGGSIVADAKGARPGTPYGDAKTVSSASIGSYNVGSYCGSFDGNGDYVDLKSINLGADFTFSTWFNTSDTNRSALVSSDNNSGSYFTIEVNGNGTTIATGRVALVVYDGTTTYTALAGKGGLNNGQWHNAMAVRSGSQVHIYIDGEREGTANIGAAYGSLGTKTVYAAARPRGTPDFFFKGLIDEVCVWGKALSDAEIGYNYFGGYVSQGTGEYISEVVNAGDPAIWRLLAWVTDGPYSRPLSGADPTLAAVWHMEETSGVISNSVAANDGTVNGATYGASGRFLNCLDFTGASSVSIVNDSDLEPPDITVEAWINADDVISRTIFYKNNGTSGYVLGLDAAGKPFFRVGSTNCTGYLPVRAGKWTHVAGCYDTVSSKIRLYVDGELAGITPPVAVSTVSGQPAFIGSSAGPSLYFDGRIDEVAIHSRALGGEEILDHYRAGAVTLKLQARSTFSDPTFSGVSFIGPDKTTNTFFTDASGSSLTNIINLGQYFQYKAYLATEDYKLTPKLSGVRVYVANYPTGNPTVEPDSTHAIYFPGRLRRFTDTVVAGGAGANVRYQISGDSGATPSWYYWTGTQWTNDGPANYNFASTQSQIDQNITNFFDLFYSKTGGNLRFRAFLHSLGDYQMQLDKVDFVASAGRIIVTVPNGGEVGTKAWIVGTPQTITWTTDGTVSTNLAIELYDQSGSNFVATLASGIPNTGSYTVKIADNTGLKYRIKIRDINDSTIYDISDNDFWLVQDFHIITPDGGEQWYIGATNTVIWDSPGPALYDYGTPADLWFSNDGGTNWFTIARPPNAIGRNQYVWGSASNDASLVSENAKMGVSVPDAPSPVDAMIPGDDSDNTFVMAGIAITYPTTGTSIKMGNSINILWKAAGAGTNGVTIDFFNGTTWTNLSTNATCVAGDNSFAAVLTAPNPNNAAKIKITANQFPLVWGESFEFTLADINIITPKGSYGSDRDQWSIGSTNYITWTSGGVSNNVDIEFSVDSSNWFPIAMDYPNTNSGGTVVTNYSPAWVTPGPPSSSAVVRVKSVSQSDLYAITEHFNMNGVQVTSPNGGETWEFGTSNEMTWAFMGPANIDIKLAYVDNPLTNDYEVIATSVNTLARRRPITAAQLRRPTNYGRFWINATTNISMFDVSDNAFRIRGLLMTYPQTNAIYTMGVNVVTGLQWYTAGANDNSAEIYYASDGSNFNDLVLSPLNMFDDTTSFNQQDWSIPRNVLPSETAKLKVVAGSYSAISPLFTLRGIRVLTPSAGAMYDIGTNKFVTWRAAGLGGGFASKLAGALSTTGPGGPYTTAGLTTNVSANSGTTAWTIDPNLVDPTTNAVIRFTCWTPTNHTDIVMYSDAFTLRGMKFVSPATGTNWMLGTSVNVSFLSAGLGAGALGAVYYSPDGVTFDMTKPVTNNMLINDGLNTMTWNIENTSALTRMPSTNGVLKIVSGSLSTVSQPFTLGGVKVTTPGASDIWAVSDLTNTIKWVGINTVNSYDLSYTVWNGTTPTFTGTIASGVPGPSFDWPMPVSAVGSNVTISITDGTVTGESERFEVVNAPSIRIISPAAGDFWKVTESNTIQWIQGGRMSNQFVLAYSSSPFAITNVMKVGSFDSTNNIFSHAWNPIPNALGQVRIIITNIVNSSIADQFENFRIAPKFNITPFGTNVYALSPQALNWVTRGDVSAVDIYYSVDPLRATNSWTKMNTVPFSANVGHDLPATTNLIIPNVKTNSMWVRVQDSTYSEVFDAAKPGPYDDTGPFTVKYYSIIWRVFDEATTQQMDSISMQDDLGWSASDLTSPILHEYPYGTWTVVFYRQFFDNLPVLDWEANPSRTIDVTMKRSQIEPDPHVLTTFAYDISNRTFTIHSWLERNGQILATPSQCIISVFRSDGSTIAAMTNNVCDKNGVFWQQWVVPAIYTSTDVFFAKVEVKFSGTTYSAGLTFTLRLAAGEETVQAVDAIVRLATSNILDGVSGVSAGVSNLTTMAQTISGDVSNLTSIANGISADVATVRTNVMSLTNALLPGIEMLTNAMTVLEPTISNMNEAVTNMALDDDLGRILNRTTSVSLGSTNRVLYKTRKGYDSSLVNISVSSPALGTVFNGNMGEITPGIYESELVASWGVGTFTVTCSDPRGRDSMVLTVTGSGGLEDVPPMLSVITNRLSLIEAQIANVTNSIKGTDLSGVLTSIDEVKAAVSGIQGADLSGVETKLTALASQIGSATDASSANTFFGQMAGVNSQLSSISYTSGEAFKKARSAVTEASSAGGAVASLKSMLEKGDITGVTSTLDDIRRSMEAARENMKDVSRLARIGELYDALNKMAADMNKLAESEQFHKWVKPLAETKGEGGTGGAIPDSSEGAVKVLTKQVDEMKSSVDFMRKLMNEKYEPVVQEELQGVAE